MPIAALSAPTINALGSTQCITFPTSLIKELVDNSYDAAATSISIELSSNTIDVIQVRDNGHGVRPEDRAVLGRRYCTSKLSSLEELRMIGGRTLGFRGEALASAAELAGSVRVVSKVEGEAVAVDWKLPTVKGGLRTLSGADQRLDLSSKDPAAQEATMGSTKCGDVISTLDMLEDERKASHPVGTTLRVVDFLQALPVRRQTALKDSSKEMGKIRQMLLSYALARPKVRLELKVLKAKTEKSNWAYVPVKNSTTADAVMKVMGKELAAECSLVSHEVAAVAAGEEIDKGESCVDSLRLDAFLPRSEADPTKISNKGSYISVDFRPVKSTRGILKKIYTLYKRYLRSALGSKNHNKISDPFFCLHLRCPVSSYDPNVEPAKDDVTFGEPDIVIGAVEALLINTYGELRISDSPSKTSIPASRNEAGFDLLLDRHKPRSLDRIEARVMQLKSTPETIESPPERGYCGLSKHWENAAATLEPINIDLQHDINPGTPHAHIRQSNATMNNYGVDEDSEDEILFGHQGVSSSAQRAFMNEVDGKIGKNVDVFNPWTLAKMNAPLQPQKSQEIFHMNSGTSDNQLLTPVAARHQQASSPQVSNIKITSFLPSPVASSPIAVSFPTPAPPLKRKATQKNSPHEKLHPPKESIDGWLQRTIHQQEEAQSDTAFLDPLDKNTGFSTTSFDRRPVRQTLANGFMSPVEVLQDPDGSLNDLTLLPSESRTQRVALGGPIKLTSPIHSGQGRSHVKDKPPQDQHQWSPALNSRLSPLKSPLVVRRPDQLSQPTLTELMDYEHRKVALNQSIRQPYLLRSSQSDSILPARSSPYANRQRAALAALVAGNIDEEVVEAHGSTEAVFPRGDPRGYMLQTDLDNILPESRCKRRKRMGLLPVETVPITEITHDLEQKWELDVETLSKTLAQLVNIDPYLRTGELGGGFEKKMELDGIEKSVEALVGVLSKTSGTDQSVSEAETVDVGGMIKRHLEGLA